MKGIRELYLWLFLGLSKSRHPDTNPAGREDFGFPVSLQKYKNNLLNNEPPPSSRICLKSSTDSRNSR
jgi:hypothetical protein